MPATQINIESVISSESYASRAKYKIDDMRNTVLSIQRNTESRVLARNGIADQFNMIASGLLDIENRIANIYTTTGSIANNYYNTEQNVKRLSDEIRGRF